MTFAETQVKVNQLTINLMDHNRRMMESRCRPGIGAGEDLARIFDALVTFQQQNPGTYQTLCNEAQEGGDCTLADALDAIAKACNSLEGR